MTEAEIEQVAEEVLEAHGAVGLPVDPFAIARAEGIKLAPGSYDECFDGRIEYRRRDGRGRFFLFYLEEEPPWRPEGRVRFSVSHELGHFYLPKHRDYLISGHWHGSHSGFVSDKATEREADVFATVLLMPRRRFIQRVKMKPQGQCTLRDLRKLADEVFRTSITSTAIRYAQLNFEPCCVVLSQGNRVLYSIRSEDMRQQGLGWIDQGGPVPATSITGKMMTAIAEGRTPRTEGAVDSDVWFDSGHGRPIWEEAKVLGRTGLILTLLALDEDEDDED